MLSMWGCVEDVLSSLLFPQRRYRRLSIVEQQHDRKRKKVLNISRLILWSVTSVEGVGVCVWKEVSPSRRLNGLTLVQLVLFENRMCVDVHTHISIFIPWDIRLLLPFPFSLVSFYDHSHLVCFIGFSYPHSSFIS